MLEETKTLPDRKSEENILFLPSSSYSVKKNLIIEGEWCIYASVI